MSGNRRVVTIGGNEEKGAGRVSILDWFAAQAGGTNAHIAVIPSASSNPEKRGEIYRRIFTRPGAHVSVVRPEIDGYAHEILGNASGIFVTGGDQQRLMEVLDREAIGEAITQAVDRGVIYAGTSAGASAASRSMISWSKCGGHDEVSLGRGIGLIPHVVIDQHFSERHRLPRLLRAVESSGLPGVGIDENTALLWQSDVTFTVFGFGTVTVVEPGDGGAGDFNVRILRAGSTYQLKSWPCHAF